MLPIRNLFKSSSKFFLCSFNEMPSSDVVKILRSTGSLAFIDIK